MSELDNFLKSQLEKQRQEAKPPVDWEAKKTDWLIAVNQLFDTIQGYLKESIDNGTVTVRRMPSTVTEVDRLSGSKIITYEADVLLIDIGQESIAFTPVTMLTIGGGRVDVDRQNRRTPIKNGEDIFLVRDKDHWGEVETSTNRGRRVIPFTRERLTTILKAVLM